jgi:hypothetical protein
VLGEREEQEKEPDRKTLRQNRCGALWLNRCIGKLSEGGWGPRSTEIFLLCKINLVPLHCNLTSPD